MSKKRRLVLPVSERRQLGAVDCPGKGKVLQSILSRLSQQPVVASSSHDHDVDTKDP